jgi:beta-glucosidase
MEKGATGMAGARPGWTVANQDFQAEEGAEEAMAAWARPREDRFLEAAKDDDFVGVQAYTRVRIGPDGAAHPPGRRGDHDGLGVLARCA